MIYMYWAGTTRQPRVNAKVNDYKSALKIAKRKGLQVFHLFEDEQHKHMLGTWRQDVTGTWGWISAR